VPEEESKAEAQNEEVKEELKEAPVQVEAEQAEAMAFGVPVRLFEEFGYSLEIIEELDEESRNEIIAEINY
jgi:H2-forming N5,N10-methylenetetrahydromethanopterin dehydrogenase-like enzyme